VIVRLGAEHRSGVPVSRGHRVLRGAKCPWGNGRSPPPTRRFGSSEHRCGPEMVPVVTGSSPSGDTRVLVAHSLGTVLSYTALSNYPNWAIHTFVTLGSPLASPMILDGIEPALVDGHGSWPGSVERSVNVRAVGDKAAAVALAETFGARVEDVLVDNGHRAHAPEPYLNAAATGAAIAQALAAPNRVR
jgi:pimeloyl-ACP methyl ester carboxylesterase